MGEIDSQVLALVRHALTVLGTYLASVGVFDGGEIEGLVGAIMVIVAFAWSIIQKKMTTTTVEAALAAPAGTSREKLNS